MVGPSPGDKGLLFEELHGEAAQERRDGVALAEEAVDLRARRRKQGTRSGGGG